MVFKIIKREPGEWQMHLQAVSSLSLLDMIVPTSCVSTHLSDMTSSRLIGGEGLIEDKDSEEHHHQACPSRVFLVAQYVWLDIMGSMSLRSAPCLQVDFRQIISNKAIDFREVTGLPRWLLCAFVDICYLERWKSDCQSKGQLSIRALAEKSANIETNLEMGLRKVSVRQTTEWDPSKELSARITPIYGAAALVYLHVVVSGPFPDLPEISSAVQQVSDALHVVPRVLLLGSLAWPLCVAGSLCNGLQRDEIQGIISRIEDSDEASSSTQLSIAIIRECWKLQAAGNATCDWHDGMQSLGYRLPLV